MLDKRMNDKGKNWRHVLKSLKVLDYCLHEGSEMVVTWARKNIYIIKTLREFQYIDDDGRDVGQNGRLRVVRRCFSPLTPSVRVSAKELTSLVLDEERLRTERSDRRSWKSRVTGIEEYGSSGSADYPTGRKPERRPQRRGEEAEDDIEYKLALEASKNEMEEDKKRRESRAATTADDEDLAKAIKLSKEEEELRRKELEDNNASSLFDLDSPSTSSQQAQYTGYNQGYQQQGAVDWFGNPIDQQPQQAQTTGFLNNAYSQGFPSQQTGFQNGFQQQQTGFNPSQIQQQQQQPNYLQAQQTVQPQQTAFNSINPYSQSNDFNQFHQQQQQPPQQQASSLSTGSHNPFASQQNMQTDALKPMPTGSNNPFASSFTKQQAQQQQQYQRPAAPSLSTLAEQRTATQFNTNQSSYNPIASYSAPQQIQQRTAQPRQEADPNKARLNALLASGEGMDTFGNTGDLRIPAQHTAPGTFVNSAGQNLNRLHAAQTGNNPFFAQQFTGAPQQQHSMMPAQTGPANVQNFSASPIGRANNNPFGAQQHQQTPGGSLIDL